MCDFLCGRMFSVVLGICLGVELLAPIATVFKFGETTKLFSKASHSLLTSAAPMTSQARISTRPISPLHTQAAEHRGNVCSHGSGAFNLS